MLQLRSFGGIEAALAAKKYNSYIPTEKVCPMYSKNFSKHELRYSNTARKHGIQNYPYPAAEKKLEKLCKTILQPIRDKWKAPIIVTSGYRCPELNTLIKGSKTSQHIRGEAADILPANPKDYDALKDLILSMIENGEITVGQFLIESNDKSRWLHISLPTEKHKNDIQTIKNVWWDSRPMPR